MEQGKEKYIIGLDQGTQSTKVIIFNTRGDVIVSESSPLEPVINRNPGWVEHPADDLWDSIKLVMTKIMAAFPHDKKDIIGLGLCTTRCSRVFMKKDGSLADNVMSWMDVRAYETYEDRDDIIYTCPTTGYMTHRLTGELKDTASNAYIWQFPMDPHTWQWSEDEAYFNKFNIPREKLLELQMPSTVIGYVTELAAKETGLPVGLPVIATGNDKAVEALGSGLVNQKVGLVSCGTYLTSMMYGESYIDTAASFWSNHSCIPYKYLYESSGIRYGMKHISWFREELGKEVKDIADMLGIMIEDYFAEESENLPAGSDGLMIFPDWLAAANEPYKKGVMIGFNDLTTRGHMYKAMLEGIVMTIENHYRQMVTEVGHTPEKLIISGGGSNSELMMQIFADVFGVPTQRNGAGSGAALGAAICVAKALDVYPTFEEAAEQMIQVRDVFTPVPEHIADYKTISKRYHLLHEAMVNVLKEAN